jgi:hypothetical protein
MFRECARWDLFRLKFAFERAPSRCDLGFKRNFENHAIGWDLFRMTISNEINLSRHNPIRCLTLCDPRLERGGGGSSQQQETWAGHSCWATVEGAKFTVASIH